MRTIIVYRDLLLSPSETFVRSQGEALRRFVPYYVGSRRTEGLRLPKSRTIVVNAGGTLGRIREAVSKVCGFTPGLVPRIRSLNPVLIHAHFGPDGIWAMRLAAQLRIPLIVTFHGFDATVEDRFIRHSFYSHRVYLRRREALKVGASLFIAVSHFIKNKLLQQGFPPEKILVHYIGVDTNVFLPDRSVKRERVVLFVGRLVEKKGCEYLIRAMRIVQARDPETKLVVIGDGRLRNELEGLASVSLRRATFVGTQPPERVREWMNRATVFSVPSITATSGDSEGFGMVFAEAQAMGLPVVSFATGGIPEAVAHEATGFLAAERDYESLAEYICILLNNSELWQRFSAAARKRVLAGFDLGKQAELLEGIYEDVLRGEIGTLCQKSCASPS